MAAETQAQIEQHDQLKQALITDNRDKIKYNAISANSQPICFKNYIPYNNHLVSDERLSKICPFVTKPNLPLNLWREHFMVSFIICILFAFSTIIQCWFILCGPSPYRWISLGFFVFAQLLCILWSTAMFSGAYDMGEINKYIFILSIVSLFILFPIMPVTICMMITVIESKSHHVSTDTDFERSTLWFKCVICLFVGIFQTLPQMIILIVMFVNDGYEVNTDPTQVINWSFLSSVLAMLSFCIVFASIYEDTIIYLLSIVWLCLDYTMYLFILSAMFYDNNGLIMFIIDVSIVIIPWLFTPIILAYHTLKEDVTRCWQHCMLSCIECSIILFIPLILLIFGPWTLFCFLSQILYCNLLPFCINFLEPIKYSSDWISYWYKYRIFKWIKKGHNRKEKDIRLCCVNMIILDKYYENELNQLKQNMAKNIHSNDFATKCRQLIVKNNVSEHKFSFKIPESWKWRDDYGTECSIMFSVKLYVVSRIIHIMIPIIIGVYIAYKENWKIDNINFVIKYLGFITIILYSLLIISLFFVWKSMYYHQMIIPFVEEFGFNIYDDFESYTPEISNCYVIMSTSKVLTDWIGNRDIAYIILQYVISIRIDDN